MTINRHLINFFHRFYFGAAFFFFFIGQLLLHPLFYMACGLGLTSFFLFIYHDLFETRTFLESQFIFLFAGAAWLVFLFIIELGFLLFTLLILRKPKSLPFESLTQAQSRKPFSINVDFSSYSFSFFPSFFTQIQWIRPFLPFKETHFSSIFTIFTSHQKQYSLSSHLPRGVFYPHFRFLFFFFPSRLFSLLSSPLLPFEKFIHVHPSLISPSLSIQSFLMDSSRSFDSFHEMDFNTFRPYSLHDDARRIDWRMSSRLDPQHHQFYVRQYDPVQQKNIRSYTLYLDSSNISHPLYESCLSSMAGVFSYLLSQQFSVGLTLSHSQGLTSVFPSHLDEGLDFLSRAPTFYDASSSFPLMMDLDFFSIQKIPSTTEFPLIMMDAAPSSSLNISLEGVVCFFTPHLSASQWSLIPSDWLIFTYESDVSSSRICKLETSLESQKEALHVL